MNDSKWCIPWYATTERESTLNCQKRILYRDDLFGNAPDEKLLWTNINPPELSYKKMINLENFANMFSLSADA